MDINHFGWQCRPNVNGVTSKYSHTRLAIAQQEFAYPPSGCLSPQTSSASAFLDSAPNKVAKRQQTEINQIV